MIIRKLVAYCLVQTGATACIGAAACALALREDVGRAYEQGLSALDREAAAVNHDLRTATTAGGLCSIEVEVDLAACAKSVEGNSALGNAAERALSGASRTEQRTGDMRDGT